MGNTKEDILNAAIHLFAGNGYEAVSVSQIAGALDMTKGALYRHYKNKRDIFDSILERMERGDSQQAEGYSMPEEKKEIGSVKYKKITLCDVIEYSKAMFVYWTENDFSASFRKMLTLEQFRNEEMQALYQQYLAAGPVDYLRDLFKSIGIENADKKADIFYSVMFLYYSLYDGGQDKAEIKKQFENIINDMMEIM